MRTRSEIFGWVFAVTMAVTAGGCAQDGPAAAPPAVPAETVAADKLACEPVSDEQLARIAEGAEPDVGVIELTDGQAIPHPADDDVWLVAARLHADGVDGEPAVWATNSVDGPGTILAVDGVAQAFTVWPDADTTAAQISQGGPAVADARSCLG